MNLELKTRVSVHRETDSGAAERARDRLACVDAPSCMQSGECKVSFSGAAVRTYSRGEEREADFPAVQTELIQLCRKSSWEGKDEVSEDKVDAHLSGAGGKDFLS